MSAYSSTSIPRPKNWQDFERHTKILFQCILRDPQTLQHGRAGQAQNGVDIWGRRLDAGGHLVGIQCKGKEGGLDNEVTESELRQEVRKARRFVPAISEFILVTTAPDDKKIQEIARVLTLDHETSSQPLPIAVWGWGTLESEIARYPEAMEAFHPDMTPFTRRQIATSEDIRSLTTEILGNTADLLATTVIIPEMFVLIKQMATREAASGLEESTAAKEVVEQHIHKEIDAYRDFIRQGQPRTAKALLEAVRVRVWETATERVRFRIITNLGAASLALGEDEDAERCFLEAPTYDALDPVGAANVALAYLLRGEKVEASAAASIALEKEPTNAGAAAHLIAAKVDDLTINDPFGLVPKESREAAEVCANAIMFLRYRNDESWRVTARDAAQRHPGDDLLRRFSAEAILDEIITSEQFELGGHVPGGLTEADLRSATANLLELWEKARTSEGWRGDTALPQNLARGYWALDEVQAAETVLDQALTREPNGQQLKESRAALYFEVRDPERALALVGDGSAVPGLRLMHAQSLLKEHPAAVRAILTGPGYQFEDPKQHLTAELLTVESYLREGDETEALRLAKAVVINHPRNVEAIRKLARVQRLTGADEAGATLNAAKDAVGDCTSFLERFLVAEDLDHVGRHDDAISLLERYVDTSRDSPSLRLLVNAYIHADRRVGAYALLQRLPLEVARKKPYLRALAIVHVNRRDIPSAERTLNTYLDTYPDDLEMRLRWIDTCLLQGEEEKVKSFLEDEAILVQGHPEYQMRLAHILDRFGYGERALALAYRLFLDNPDQPKIYLGYTGMLLNPSREGNKDFSIATVGPNVAFEIENDRGEKEQFIIEADGSLRVGKEYIARDDPIAKKCSGAGQGDIILWDGPSAPRQWTITWIKHKYLHALHEAMDRFERRFPSAHGLERFEIDDKKPEPFEDVFRKIKERHDAIAQALDVYAEMTIPIHVPAEALGKDIIDARYGLYETDRKFRVCIGTAIERERAKQDILSNKSGGCVADAITLSMIRRFELETVVDCVCGPICVTEATRRLLRIRLEEMENNTSSSMSVFWRDGYYYRHVTTAEELQVATESRRADLRWVEEHALIVPAVGTKDPPEEVRRINELIGGDFLDDMLAAEGTGRLLLCQDFAYRVFASQSLGVRTSWLQPLLMIVNEKGLIDRKRYDAVIIDLIEFGDDVLSVDGKLLHAASNMDIDNRPGLFAKVVGTLGGPKADMISHLGVTSDFFARIWNERSGELSTQAQTGAVLDRVLSGRYQEWQQIIATLRWQLSMRYAADKSLDEYILAWLKGHFLVPWDRRSLPRLGEE